VSTPGQYGLAAVILAAGTSSRMGSEKALLPPPGGGTLLQAAIRAFRPFTQMVLVVAGSNAEGLKPVIYAQGADLVINPEPERGQFSSLQAGLQEVLNRGRDVAVITHVDCPPVNALTLQILWRAFLESYELPPQTRKWLVVPEVAGQHGHPIIAGREMIEAFLRSPITATARDVEHSVQQRVQYVPMADSDLVRNLNTPDEYDAWIASTAP
jgi:molybdenum cofactor cytidylyltransferase